MLSFFRRFVASPLGAGILALVLLAFVVTLYDAKSLSGFGGGAAPGSGSAIATVGNQSVGEDELRRAVQRQFEGLQRNQPEITMAAFVSGGGVEQVLSRLLADRALTQFGAQQDLVVSDRLMGSAMARIPAFRGLTGQFDDKAYRAALANAKYTDAEARAEFRNGELMAFFAKPAALAVNAPVKLSEPYAALQLEGRRGLIGTVPSAAFASLTPPDDAALATFYSRNVARYTLPERRIVRYALFDRTRFEGKVAPTDAEIAKFYQTNAAAYRPSETRTLTQIVVADPALAQTLLARVKSGTSMAAAAAAAGLSAKTLEPQDRAAFEKQTGAAVAQAAFATARGNVAPLASSGLGTHIVKVDAITTTPGRSIEQARATIISEVTQQKMDEAVSALVRSIDDETADGATFDEVVKKYALTALETPAVTAGGINPETPAYRAPPETAVILRDAFKAGADDEPAVAQLGAGRNFAVWKVGKIVPAAPRPLNAIRDQVLADARIEAASKAAHKLADTIVAAINKGTPMAQAMAAAGVKLPAPVAVGSTRQQLLQAGDKAPPPLQLMFKMPARHARVTPIPESQGWYIVYLDRIDHGDVSKVPQIVARTQTELSQLLADEYREQLFAAIKKDLGTTQNDAALATFKSSLLGGTAAP
jgi:peptidyl-prolyl cis-trans isomerase D